MEISPELRERIRAQAVEWEQAADAFRFEGESYETPEQERDDHVAETYDECAGFLLSLLREG